MSTTGQVSRGPRPRRPGWPRPRGRPDPATRRTAVGAALASRRVKRDAPVTPASAYRHRGKTVGLFAIGLVLSLALLVLDGYVVGHGPELGLGGFAESVLKAATGKVTGAVIALVLLGGAAWCLQRLWIEWLAWRPGQVVIPVFTEGSTLKDANAVHLTSQFRQRFASLRLQAPAPVPGAAPEGDFLEVLGQKSLDASNPLGAVLALLYSAKPTHAYVVHGVLVERAAHPRYGVTVQVVRRPEEGSPPETVWDISWERAVRRAADRAMAHILPRTRRCEAPWASWRGFVMPAALLESYEAAAQFEQERRYDEALARYFHAVELDPMNLSLRLHIGHLQEKLGLYIDALATYEGMMAVDAASDAAPQTNVFGPVAKRERERTVVLARYRRIVLLGGPRLALQWRHTGSKDDWTERDAQRLDLRDRLRPRLTQHLSEVDPLPGGRPVAELLDEPTGEEDDPGRLVNELRRLFVHHALAEIESLHGALRAMTPRAGRDLSTLSAASLRLTKVIIEERCRWLERQLGENPQRWIWDAGTPEHIAADIERATGGRQMLRWHERYNAACAYALPLLVEDHSAPDVRDALAVEAVDQLQQATSCADSGYIATRRDWLLSEDPDLAGLRAHRCFKAFEAMYFPAAAPTPRRPRIVQPLEVSRYAGDILDAAAVRWQAEWRARGRHESPPELHELVKWWENEAELWHLVGRSAWNHRRWRARFELLERVDELSISYGGTPVDVAFRTLDEPWMCLPTETQVEERAAATLADSTNRQTQLARWLADGPPSEGRFQIEGIDDWIDHLRDCSAEGKPPEHEIVTKLCRHHAAVWERLDVWLAAPAERAETASAYFTDELARLTAQLRANTPLRPTA
jgi:tetratricopeptide (TPR) repeat protein